MTTFLSSLTVILVCLVGVPLAVEAQTTGSPLSVSMLNLSASGESEATPDVAGLTLGVETTAPTAAEAMRGNAASMVRILAALKATGLAARDIQTSNLSLQPQYIYEQNKPARLSGYQAANQINVVVRDLTRVGPVADAAVGAGASNVGQISFGLSDPVASENAARIAAVKALEDKAALYAQAVGYHIGRLVSLSEGAPYSPGPRPMPLMAMRGAAADATPVQPGELKVRIELNGQFELTR